MWLSFYDWDGLGTKTWLGLDNYVELFDDEAFYTSLYNNIIWLVLYMLAVPAGLFIALFLNQTVTGIRIYKSLFFFPFVISQVVVGLIFSWFYAPNFGLFYNLIEWLTAPGSRCWPIDRYVTYGIIAAGLWPQIAYCMILYLTGLNNVDPDQIEAGRLDGAKGWKMLWYIILPQLKPATFIAFVVTVIGALQIVRPDLDHDRRRAVRLDPRAVVLHVRAGAVRIRLPHGLWRRDRGGAVPAIMLVFIGFLWKMWRDEKGPVMFPDPSNSGARDADRLQGVRCRLR
jgi:multiple sugar transport system permease protein